MSTRDQRALLYDPVGTLRETKVFGFRGKYGCKDETGCKAETKLKLKLAFQQLIKHLVSFSLAELDRLSRYY